MLDGIESYRQPSVYYFTSQEHQDGPVLICDWSGPSPELDALDVDTIIPPIDKTSQALENLTVIDPRPVLNNPPDGMLNDTIHSDRSNSQIDVEDTSKVFESTLISVDLKRKGKAAEKQYKQPGGNLGCTVYSPDRYRFGYLTVPPMVEPLLTILKNRSKLKKMS